jgi:hypothetical protein
VAEETPARAFAATWRNPQGEVVATTSARSMCLWPLLPWRIRFHRDGFEGVIPCRECPGCLELERQRLSSRLHEKYGARAEQLKLSPSTHPPTGGGRSGVRGFQLFVIRIWAPIELHAQLAHRLHRRPSLDLEPGMWRLGASSFALLSRGNQIPRSVLRSLGLRFRIEPLQLRRGRRAWRPLTAGLLVAREVYGEQRNRFYARGLPKVDRQKWEVRKVGSYSKYDRARSPRAWSGSNLVLVPPEVWGLSRTDRRSLRGLLTRASDPEGVRRVMGLVADAIGSDRTRIPVSAAGPKGRLTREQVENWYSENAKRLAARTALPEDRSVPLPSEGGGDTSSEHSQGELMPEQLQEADRKAWREGRKAKALRESLEIIERMRLKSTGKG